MSASQALALGFFIGTALTLWLCFTLAFHVIRNWFDRFSRIVECIERRDAGREEANREIINLLRKITDTQIGLMDGMNVLGQAQRSMIGKTERLYQRVEYWEAQQRGEEVPELEQRQYRTTEENDLISRRGE